MTSSSYYLNNPYQRPTTTTRLWCSIGAAMMLMLAVTQHTIYLSLPSDTSNSGSTSVLTTVGPRKLRQDASRLATKGQGPQSRRILQKKKRNAYPQPPPPRPAVAVAGAGVRQGGDRKRLDNDSEDEESKTKLFEINRTLKALMDEMKDVKETKRGGVGLIKRVQKQIDFVQAQRDRYIKAHPLEEVSYSTFAQQQQWLWQDDDDEDPHPTDKELDEEYLKNHPEELEAEEKEMKAMMMRRTKS